MKTHTPYISLESPPATEPITLSEAKLFLRVDDTIEDTLISNLIATARKAAETYTRRSLITQSWKISYDDYAPSKIRLFNCPVQSITSVASIARDSNQTVLAASKYYLNAGKDRLIIDTALISHRVEIIYVTGYGNSASDIPENIRQGMLSHIARLFEKRSEDVPLGAASKSLYDSYRIVRL